MKLERVILAAVLALLPLTALASQRVAVYEEFTQTT